jgi:glucose-6-phosphate 1-epimerase
VQTSNTLRFVARASTEAVRSSDIWCLQFGPGKMQQHGFARNVEWSVSSTSADLQPDERDPSIELVLTPSEYSEEMFPFKFKVVYTVTLHGEQLQTNYRLAPTLR